MYNFYLKQTKNVFGLPKIFFNKRKNKLLGREVSSLVRNPRKRVSKNYFFATKNFVSKYFNQYHLVQNSSVASNKTLKNRLVFTTRSRRKVSGVRDIILLKIRDNFVVATPHNWFKSFFYTNFLKKKLRKLQKRLMIQMS